MVWGIMEAPAGEPGPVLCALHLLSHVTVTTTPSNRWCHPRFTDEEVEVQRTQ